VQNFGESADGQTDDVNPGMNQIIGVTSFGHNDFKLEGSSVLDDRLLSLLDTMCGHREGNCD
jgi:hypothetical protein